MAKLAVVVAIEVWKRSNRIRTRRLAVDGAE
jgi:hypothetical protein